MVNWWGQRSETWHPHWFKWVNEMRKLSYTATWRPASVLRAFLPVSSVTLLTRSLEWGTRSSERPESHHGHILWTPSAWVADGNTSHSLTAVGCACDLRNQGWEITKSQIKSPHDPAGGGTEGRRKKQQWWWKQSSQQQISQDMTGERKRERRSSDLPFLRM